MRKVDKVGGLPKHIQIFLKKVPGAFGDKLDTEIYEMQSISEFEKGAAGQIDEKIRYEIVPTHDNSTGRAFLVGFDVSDTNSDTDFTSSKLMLYFIEITESEYTTWFNRIKNDKMLQIEEMAARRERQERKRMLGQND